MSQATQHALREGILKVNEKRAAELADQDKRTRTALASGSPPPTTDPPRASAPRWVLWASSILRTQEVPKWVSHDEIAALDQDVVSPVIEALLRLPEFEKLLAADALTIVWTPGMVATADLLGKTPRVGRIRVLSERERLTWSRPEAPADFRLELSLPYVLLATADELERGLHELLAACAYDDEKPKLLKPDISTFASTLGRYGVSTAREASAVAHALRGVRNARLVRDFGFDVETGQGLLWEPMAPRQSDLVDAARQVRDTLKRYGATMRVETERVP